MPRRQLIIAAAATVAAASAAAPAAADISFRTVTLDYRVEHVADWQAGDAAGRQALTLATRRPVRQALVVHSGADVPFGVMTNDELIVDPPRGRVERRLTGAAPCAVRRPRVRSRFEVEGRGRRPGSGPWDLELLLGAVRGLARPCPPAAAEVRLAVPPPIPFERGAERIRRMRRGDRLVLRARVERGLAADGAEAEACAPRPEAGPWECATTTATLRVRRVE